ncbi:hypothetical protein [Ligilactobacillus saerimneri]|uniref:hypothetical protein n=1 Tax=Ligilactobacillus saerimneri TaxID=228229 RepID=UPI0024319D3A|nr:hypothetical protein [Ligilactobacillus saerimneri]
MSYVFATRLVRGRKEKAMEPLVSVTKRAVCLNEQLLKKYPGLVGEYVRLGVDYEENKMMLIFQEKREEKSFKCHYNERAKQVSVRSEDFIDKLNQTECLALQRFRYRFKPMNVDMNNRFLEINLKDPYEKLKVRKKR